jgi:hypothetical protein
VGTFAALAFAFGAMRWFRLHGHLHILWASSLLPWLAWSLERVRRLTTDRVGHRAVYLCGLVWGVMIDFSLYGVFLGGAMLLLWGRGLLSWTGIRRALAVCCVAALAGCLTIVPYALSIRQDPPVPIGISQSGKYGASLNSLPIPSVRHPLPLVRKVASAVYAGPQDESGRANSGFIATVLGLLGLALARRRKKLRSSLMWLMVVGYILALGSFLRWDGEIVDVPIMEPLTRIVWRLGHLLKPGVFSAPTPDAVLAEGLPLPGLLLTAVVPFYESARTVSRFMIVGHLGLVVLAAYGARCLPRWLRYVFLVLWAIETLPFPVTANPVPTDLHPAYAWLREQELPAGEGIVDMAYPSVKLSPDILYAAPMHGVPTASGYGSVWPQHTHFLNVYFWRDPEALGKAESVFVLRSFGVRYLFLHRPGGGDEMAWNMIQQNPGMAPLRCFAPAKAASPWPYPICVAELGDLDPRSNVLRTEGWSGAEEWGIWAEGTESHARWVATSQRDHRISVEVFPFCVPGREQAVSIEVNGRLLDTHRWRQCDAWKGDVLVAGSLVEVGWNDIVLRYGYAVRPIDLESGQSTDPRALAVGWSRLTVEPVR